MNAAQIISEVARKSGENPGFIQVTPRTVRMDISALPNEAQHFRSRVIPSAMAIVGPKGVRWAPCVLNGQMVNHPILWTGTATDDRDEAFTLAGYSADRFVVADYLHSIDQISLPPTG